MLAKRLLKENKGFSLVEAIIAFAIAAIAGVAVFGFMSSGSNLFRNTSNDVGLQYEQQMVVNKVREYLSEASNAITYDDTKKTLYIYNQDSGTYELERLTFDILDGEETGKLVYANKDDYAASVDVNVDDVDGLTATDVGYSVKDITYDLSKISKGKITFDITFLSDGKEITSKQVVYLRNTVVNSNALGDIYTVESKKVDSFIKSITIVRDGMAFDQTSTDTIKLLDDSDVEDGVKSSGFVAPEKTSVHYSAIVDAKNDYSTREYSVTWSISYAADPDNTSNYITVEPSTGTVTVNKSAIGKTFILKATSVDDASKYQTLNIKIESDGVYPYRLELPNPVTYKDEIGYRVYNVYPTIYYTDGSIKTDSSLCTWVDLNDLPDGVTFDLATNKLTATSMANDQTVKLAVTVKTPCADGTYLKADFNLKIENVPEYVPKQKLSLTGTKTKYNNRADETYVSAVWENAETSKFTYHWEIKPVEDDKSRWDKSGSDNKRVFNKNFYIINNRNTTVASNKLEATTTYQNRMINIYCEPTLDWSNTYKIEVFCYAEDEKGELYGNGNTKDKNYNGPVSCIVEYAPVEYLLKPKTRIVYNSNTYKFCDSKTLKMSGYDVGNGFGYKTLRVFEIETRGLNYNRYKEGNSGQFTLKSSLTGSTSTLSREATFDFYNNTGALETLGAQYNYLYDRFDFSYNNQPLEGFWMDMGDGNNVNSNFKTAFESKQIKKMDVRFRLKDSVGNSVDGKILEGVDSVTEAEIITDCSEYKYTFKLDKNDKEVPN